LPPGKSQANPAAQQRGRQTGLSCAGRELSRLRACGADNGTANRTPSAWMISLAVFLAHGQIVFFVWVTFGERKWSILAERRSLQLHLP
jgi:hypothetical protein